MGAEVSERTRLPGCNACITSAVGDKLTIQENGFDGYKCADCSLIYVGPQPDLSAVEDLYGHGTSKVSAQELIEAYNSFGKKLKAKLTLKFIRSFVSEGRLLEIGAGGGAFLKEARKYFDVAAAEFNPDQTKHLKSVNIDCRQGVFSEVFKGEKFDVIYFCDVLSHFMDPIGDLRAIKELLSPSGVIFFETGNNGDLQEKYYHLTDSWQYPDHLFFFSEKSLKNLTSASGLRIVFQRTYSRLAEMKADQVLRSAKMVAKRERGQSQEPGGKAATKSKLIFFAMNAKHIMDYLLIYFIGRALPKEGRPQTILVCCTPSERAWTSHGPLDTSGLRYALRRTP